MANGSVKSIFAGILCTYLCFVFFVFSITTQSAFSPALRVIACDVGQGDATLIKYGQLIVLIDVGPNSAIKQCLQANISPLRPIIDLLVLTHDDKDHIGGFSDAVSGYRIGTLFMNPKIKDTKSAQTVLDWMSVHNNVQHPLEGQSFVFPGVHLSIVWSEDALLRKFGSQAPDEGSNDGSLGLYIESQGFGFLSLGDLGCAQELAVSGSPLLKKVHILKMSHHGSKTSSCLDYLERIRPEAAYYMAGKGNTYGHPAPSSLDNIVQTGAFLRGTDQIGSIFFAWKEKRLYFSSSNEVF